LKMTVANYVDDAAQSLSAVCCPGSLNHLLRELKRIDEFIQTQVEEARQQQGDKDEYKGLFISEREVDALLARSDGQLYRKAEQAGSAPDAGDVPTELCGCRLGELRRVFELSDFDLDCVLICLAPELDSRYERLYGYLQDDVTKRWPSVDLMLNLLCPTFELKLANRERFLPAAPLVIKRILQPFEDPSHPQPTVLGKFLKLDERIASYLLNSDGIDARLLQWSMLVRPHIKLDDLVMPAEDKRRLANLAQQNQGRSVVLYLQGPYGRDRRTTAEALCSNLGIKLLAIEGQRLAGMSEADFRQVVEIAFREAVLQRAALYWGEFDAHLADDKSALLAVLLREVANRQGITFLAGENAWEPAGELGDALFVRSEVHRPSHTERIELWERAMEQNGELDLSTLSSKFRFTAGQIQDAAGTARNLAHWRDPEADKVTIGDLYEACRLQCNRKLSSLAKKIKPHYAWEDIILPMDRVQQLREICNSLKYRSVVYERWGFDRKLALGKGLNILFAGPPGTGKTMAADIMAGELGLDLYKTDLSTIVSKYIGETEKNLSRIFAEAETSNAILFFDEADALFGKRSEVRDSHDRYANIQTNYLLQKMEEHEGVVILATNFRKNMDEAFVRRLHFTIDFPFPDEGDRRRIWETIWPDETPRHVELDLASLARRFEVAGGNIRNIALGAAFLAADNGGVIKMQHLLHATRREYQKMGKVVSHGEFEEAAC
jgi:ATP-dependent 26S proteasome regulatory subunit